MLVLSRGLLSRANAEWIDIGKGGELVASICVVAVRNDGGGGPNVRLGIEAAGDVVIHRREVTEAIRRERDAQA